MRSAGEQLPDARDLSTFRSALPNQRWPVVGVCLALAALTFAVFAQTTRFDFVDFDDNEYVYENPIVIQGLTWKGMAWAFGGAHASNVHPITWLSHMLDCQIYGLHSGGHHLTNVILHTATVVLLFLVLRRMTSAFWSSAGVAALFAIHPLRAETVAWVAERKDVLSGLFFILTIAAYGWHARAPRSGVRFSLVLLLFALGLMSKPMLVTLPLVLLLLDFWPLRRVESFTKLLMEKIPLLVLSLADGVATVMAQTGAMPSGVTYSLPHRLGNAVDACVTYLRQMVWPVKLAAFYPYPHGGASSLDTALAGGLLAGISVLAFWQRRPRPWLLVGWLWYLVMLIPVLGLIQVGAQSHADRYTYLPQIGIDMMAVWLLAELQVNRVLGGIIVAAVLGALSVRAWRQTACWTNSETLWRHAFACTPDNQLARYNLGAAYYDEGKIDQAITELQRSLELDPAYVRARFRLAEALMKAGRVDDALTQYTAALRLAPNYAEVHASYGNALLRKGDVNQAMAQFREASELRPDLAQPHYNLANILLQAGHVDDAIHHYEAALQIDHGYASAHVNLGAALLQKGQTGEALDHFEQALRIDPQCAPAHVNLASLLLRRGDRDAAIAHLQRALQIAPNFGQAREILASALGQKQQSPSVRQ